jgi:hypothetical protein
VHTQFHYIIIGDVNYSVAIQVPGSSPILYSRMIATPSLPTPTKQKVQILAFIMYKLGFSAKWPPVARIPARNCHIQINLEHMGIVSYHKSIMAGL